MMGLIGAPCFGDPRDPQAHVGAVFGATEPCWGWRGLL